MSHCVIRIPRRLVSRLLFFVLLVAAASEWLIWMLEWAQTGNFTWPSDASGWTLAVIYYYLLYLGAEEGKHG
jgi:hypothetical protein